MKQLIILAISIFVFGTGFTSCGKKDDPISPQVEIQTVYLEKPIKCEVDPKEIEKPHLYLDDKTPGKDVLGKGNAAIVDRRNLLDYSKRLETVLKKCSQEKKLNGSSSDKPNN